MIDTTYDKWDHRFLDLAELVGSWSKDPSTRVGACLVQDRRVISTGFNGYPKGVSDNYPNRDHKIARTIHAEANALHFAPWDVDGCSIYITHPPCSHCAAHLIQRGIDTVVFNEPDDYFMSRWAESFEVSMDMLNEVGIVVLQRKRV